MTVKRLALNRINAMQMVLLLLLLLLSLLLLLLLLLTYLLIHICSYVCIYGGVCSCLSATHMYLCYLRMQACGGNPVGWVNYNVSVGVSSLDSY